MFRNTKIVCTLGPASESLEILRDLVKNGMNVARLNFSHGSHEEHLVRINAVKQIRKELNRPIAILLDTKGPEIRTGKFKDPVVTLEEGQQFILTTEEILGDNQRCSISYKGLPNDVEPGGSILIDDGLIRLEVKEIKGSEIICIVKNGGEVKNNKGVNVPNVQINLPAITEKDRADIEFGIKNDIDLIAASFVRKPEDVLEIRKILEENKAKDIQIISKIENQQGVDNLDDIIAVSDGIMVARGDLGVEIPTEEMPIVQKMMIGKCNKVGKPVITATQMLDSMMRNPRPTRAEVTDVANAIFDGTDAIMLSGETAAGKYPVESVKTMATIAKRTESALNYKEILAKKATDKAYSVTNAISHATCTTAQDLQATAIITATSSGHTARMVSKFRPEAPIIAATPNERVMRTLALTWGVYPILIEQTTSTDALIESSVDESLKSGLIAEGDLVVITAGVPVGVAGTTNLIKVHVVSKVVAKGTGIGSKGYFGKAVIIKDSNDYKRVQQGDVIVVHSTDKDMINIIEKAGAIVTEEGGLTSHAAIMGLNFGIPVIVGADNITELLEDGTEITIDSIRGLVYQGRATVR